MHVYWRGDGAGWWWWLPMSLAMLVFWGGLLALVVVLVRQARWRDASDSPYPPESTHPADPTAEARRILAERFARGEIDLEDYRHRLEALSTPGPDGRPRP